MEEKEMYMDGFLRDNLDTAKRIIKKDWDMLFMYDGGEGGGKSTIAIQNAYYCDNTLTLSRIVFTPNQFKRAIMEAQPYQAVVYDEAYTGLSSRSTMSQINRTIVAMLTTIRQKNLFVFIVMPCFFDMDKYVALWRSRALIHVYTGDDFEREYFAFYNVDKKKDLYINGKKFYTYYTPKPNFTGRFTKFFPVDEKEYRKKKLIALGDRELQIEEAEKNEEVQALLYERVMNFEGMTEEAKARLLGINPVTLWRHKKEKEREKNEM